jgi:hypothetical protein
MSHNRKQFLVAAFIGLMAIVAVGWAQDGQNLGRRDLGLKVRRQGLDAYWLDTHTWQEYGYRRHIKTPDKPWMNFPSYFAGLPDYASGTSNPFPGQAEFDTGNSDSKRRIQMTKYGTWH